LIVDHAAVAGTKNASAQTLHRIDEAFAKQDIESHGFKLEKTWDGYRNPSDDLSKNVFLPAVRGKTDRFTHLYRKLVSQKLKFNNAARDTNQRLR